MKEHSRQNRIRIFVLDASEDLASRLRELLGGKKVDAERELAKSVELGAMAIGRITKETGWTWQIYALLYLWLPATTRVYMRSLNPGTAHLWLWEG
jgi:hypothetical protein